MPERILKTGVVGLGLGAARMVRVMEAAANIELTAAADLDPEVRGRFQTAFPHVKMYDSIEALAADPNVDAVWLSTPNRDHAVHTRILAQAGKHIMVQKPMAVTMQQAEEMCETADKYNVRLMSGHSQAFSPPIRLMRQIVMSGELGKLCAVNAFAYNSWLLSTRKSDDILPVEGGGIVYRNSPHQIDCIRLIGGGMLRTIRGTFGQWLNGRPGPGYYSAFMEFADGTPAVIFQNSYGYFFADEFVPYGSSPEDSRYQRKAHDRAALRQAFRDGTRDETADYEKMGIGRASDFGQTDADGTWVGSWMASDLGIVLVSCERGDIRQSPEGLFIYDDDGIREVKLPKRESPSTWDLQLSDLYKAVVLGQTAYHDGRWGMATLEVALGIVESARTHRDVELTHQISMPDGYDEAYRIEPEEITQIV